MRDWRSPMLRRYAMSEPLRPTAYCVRCKATREITDVERVVVRNGKEAFQGKCPTCGGMVFKIMH